MKHEHNNELSTKVDNLEKKINTIDSRVSAIEKEFKLLKENERARTRGF